MEPKRPILTDADISSLLARHKMLPREWRKRLHARSKPTDGHIRNELTIEENKEKLSIKCRQNSNNPLVFSIVLMFTNENNHRYIILRCNGIHPSEHTNRWEKLKRLPNHTFTPCFHIHKATQRYQEEDLRIDGYAEPTESYSDFHTALDHFVEISGFHDPGDEDTNLRLFGSTI